MLITLLFIKVQSQSPWNIMLYLLIRNIVFSEMYMFDQ